MRIGSFVSCAAAGVSATMHYMWNVLSVVVFGVLCMGSALLLGRFLRRSAELGAAIYHHPTRGVARCACGEEELPRCPHGEHEGYEDCLVGATVHTVDWCGPVAEWVPPGR